MKAAGCFKKEPPPPTQNQNKWICGVGKDPLHTGGDPAISTHISSLFMVLGLSLIYLFSFKLKKKKFYEEISSMHSSFNSASLGKYAI